MAQQVLQLTEAESREGQDTVSGPHGSPADRLIEAHLEQ